jgi:hypothetical protein
MKAKTLRRIDTKEFVHISLSHNNCYMAYTSDLPKLMPMTCTIDGLKFMYKNDLEYIFFDDYELIEVDVCNTEEIGADIRNKLTPIKNLLSLLTLADVFDLEEKPYKLLLKEIEQCEVSLKYLSELL